MAAKKSKKEERNPLVGADLAAAKRLRALWDERKKSRKLTYDRAGELMGMTPSNVSHMLNERNAVGLMATVQFAILLGVHPDAIRDDLPGLELFTKNFKFGSGSAQPSESQPVIHTPATVALAKTIYRNFLEMQGQADVAFLEQVDDEHFSLALNIAFEELDGNARDHAVRNDVGLLKKMAAAVRGLHGNQRRKD